MEKVLDNSLLRKWVILTSKMATPMSELLIKGRYSINTNFKNILGKGSYGIVFKALDKKNKNSIAAKSIDGEKHPKVFKDNRQNLLGLNHGNIIKILELYQIEKTFWMMMEFCKHGHLNHFFRKKNPDIHTKVEIINGIAQELPTYTVKVSSTEISNLTIF